MNGFFGFIKYVLEGWQVTTAASVIVVGIIIIVLIICGAMRWQYKGIIVNQDIIITKLKESKIADIATLKERLDLAKDQNDTLNNEIKNLRNMVAILETQSSTTAEVARDAILKSKILL